MSDDSWIKKSQVFSRSGRASDQDVMDAYGQDMIDEYVADAIPNGMHTVYEKIPGPLSENHATIAVYRHFKNIINQQRGINFKIESLCRRFEDDPDNPSPLNPMRTQTKLPIEDEMDIRQSDRNYGPLFT